LKMPLLNVKRLPPNVGPDSGRTLWRSEPTFLNRADSRSGCQPHALEERAIKKSISVICVYHGEVSVAGEVYKTPEKSTPTTGIRVQACGATLSAAPR